MSDNAEDTALIVTLTDHIARGKRMLGADGGVKMGMLKIWVGTLRHRLKALYGTQSEIFLRFPLIPDLFPADKAKGELVRRIESLEGYVSALEPLGSRFLLDTRGGSRVFIGHGRSPVWRELKDFLQDRLHLPWDEFNREAVAGYTTFERLDAMLSAAAFACLIMTAEDEHADTSLHARGNVIHEVGLFQGRLGPRKAVILLEEGCAEFSNIIGLSQLRFPRGRISAVFEELRRVLERERVVAAQQFAGVQP